jgi:uncharacterized protein DUF6455
MSESSIVLLITVGVSCVLMIVGVLRSLRGVRTYRRDLIARARALRLHRMLERLGIGLERYLRRARPIEVEKHLLVCEHCGMTDICDDCLEGRKDIDERKFCPNLPELSRYRRQGKPSTGESR